MFEHREKAALEGGGKLLNGAYGLTWTAWGIGFLVFSCSGALDGPWWPAGGCLAGVLWMGFVSLWAKRQEARSGDEEARKVLSRVLWGAIGMSWAAAIGGIALLALV